MKRYNIFIVNTAFRSGSYVASIDVGILKKLNPNMPEKNTPGHVVCTPQMKIKDDKYSLQSWIEELNLENRTLPDRLAVGLTLRSPSQTAALGEPMTCLNLWGIIGFDH